MNGAWPRRRHGVGQLLGLRGAQFEIFARSRGLSAGRDFFVLEAGALDFADGGFLVRAAAEEDLVEFLALLVDAENADVADMVVAAGVDAARHVDVQRADFVLEFRIGEQRLDFVGDGDRTGVGEVAIVETRARR